MRSRLQTATVVIGTLFALQGVAWLLTPARAASGLGMPLLDGLGRSTQIGDFSAFFLTLGVTTLLGSRPGRSRLLYVPACILGAAALLRMLAWAIHGAAFATAFIIVEIVSGAVLLTAAGRQEA